MVVYFHVSPVWGGTVWKDSKGEWGPGLSSHQKVTAHGTGISEGEERLWHRTFRVMLQVLKRCTYPYSWSTIQSWGWERENHKERTRLFFVCLLFIYLFFGHAYGILVPWPGIGSGPSAVKAWRNSAREFPRTCSFWMVGIGWLWLGISKFRNYHCSSQVHQELPMCQISFPFLFTSSAAFDPVWVSWFSKNQIPSDSMTPPSWFSFSLLRWGLLCSSAIPASRLSPVPSTW